MDPKHRDRVERLCVWCPVNMKKASELREVRTAKDVVM